MTNLDKSVEARRNLHTHTHTHTDKALLSPKQIGTICFAKFFKFCAVAFVAIFCGLFCNIESAHAVDYPFSLTTSSISSGGTFKFNISAQGTFYVDCGTGGTLSGTGVSGGTINKTDTKHYTFVCTYSSDGTKTFRFGGTATNYNTDTNIAAISFNYSAANAALITSISGNLSTIFPYISGNAANGAQPRFYFTFKGANITSIPDTLFSGYTVASTYMFHYTFGNCTGLTSIPANLFFPNATSVSGADSMFYNTFQGCTGLTSIPENLFSKITSGASRLFFSTFYGCTGLTSIPANLFFPNATSVSGADSMFYNTFQGCTGLTSIPANLFSKITSGASELFRNTFNACKGLTSIPANLFFPNATSVSGASNMFANTFKSCKGLTSIPENLFSKITSGATDMFMSTFQYCSNLTGYIPPTFFDGLIKNNAATNTFNNTFGNTGMWTSCTSGTPYATDYTSAWGGKVSCAEPINLTWDGSSTTAPTSCTYGSTFVPPTPPSRTGYIFTGWKVNPPCDQQIKSLDISINGIADGATFLDGYANDSNANKWGLRRGSGEIAVEFDYGLVYGKANCNTTQGSNFAAGTPQTTSSGKYCWCQVTGFTPAGNSYTTGPKCTVSVSSSWVYIWDAWSTSACTESCTSQCASFIQTADTMRSETYSIAGR